MRLSEFLGLHLMLCIKGQEILFVSSRLLGLCDKFEGLKEKPSHNEVQYALGQAVAIFDGIGADDLASMGKGLMSQSLSGNPTVAAALIRNLHDCFERKMFPAQVGVIEIKDSALYERATVHLCESEIHHDLATSSDELNLSGKALACGLSTAAVMHAMRAVEASLHSLCNRLGLSFPNGPVELQDWKVLSDKIKSASNQVETQGRSQAKTELLSRIGQLLVPAEGFRNAWRNHVAHARQKYEYEEARVVLDYVGQYFKRLSEAMHEH